MGGMKLTGQQMKLAVSIAISIAIFILDILTPLGYAVYLLYVIPLFIAVSATRSIYIPVYSMVYTILTISSYFLSAPAGDPGRASVNRTMGIFALWLISFLLGKSKKATEALDRANEELEIRVEERTSELMHVNAVLEAEIAEHKQTEERLRQLALQNRMILESAGEGVIGLDMDGNHTFVNPAAAKMLGYGVDELIGRHSHLMWHHSKKDGSPYPEEECPMHVALRDRTVHHTRDEVFWRKDGTRFDVEYTSTPIIDNDKIVGAVLTFRDITSRKKIEEALKRSHEELELRVMERTSELARSNEELEKFAYVSSHDLQEPLRMVSSFVQLLAKRYKGRLDQDADDFINFAVDGANRMQTLITDLLAYSRVGRRGREFREVSSEAVLDHALLNLGTVIEQSGAVVTKDPLPVVTGDETQLVQLFQNLIGNAIKFCKGRTPRIHIAAEQKKNEWFFSVRDNGIGIAPEYYERIFSIFQRLQSRQEYPGTGIGLAICRKVVERHGGRIWLESEPGLGSTFYFTLPVKGR